MLTQNNPKVTKKSDRFPKSCLKLLSDKKVAEQNLERPKGSRLKFFFFSKKICTFVFLRLSPYRKKKTKLF